MGLRRRAVYRLHRLCLYWGLAKHPFGIEFARRQYTALGGVNRSDPDDTAGRAGQPQE